MFLLLLCFFSLQINFVLKWSVNKLRLSSHCTWWSCSVVPCYYRQQLTVSQLMLCYWWNLSGKSAQPCWCASGQALFVTLTQFTCPHWLTYVYMRCIHQLTISRTENPAAVMALPRFIASAWHFTSSSETIFDRCGCSCLSQIYCGSSSSSCSCSSTDVAPQQRFITVLIDQEILRNQGECG